MKVYAPVGKETFDDIQTTEEAQGLFGDFRGTPRPIHGGPTIG